MMTQIEHLQAIYFAQISLLVFFCYEDQFTSYFMLCKVILRAVSNSEKSHEVFLNGGSR